MAGEHRSADEVLRLIDTGHEASVVGTFEAEDLDFKGEVPLANDRDRWELAKDIAAMANRGGGLIAVGFRTALDPDRAEEIVTEVHPFPSEVFDPKQILDIASRWVYPPARVHAVRHPRDDGALGTIQIDVDRRDVPYLVTRMPADGDRFPSEVAFGWPRRQGTQTIWTPIGQIHRHLRPTEQAAFPSEPRPVEPLPDATPLVDELDVSMGWTDRAILFLVAQPVKQQSIPLAGFYDEEGGVIGAIRKPFELRYAGFGITYGHDIEVDVDGRIISNDDERALIVRPDGVAIAALAAAPHFLTRGGGSERPSEPSSRVVNPVVITEWTYLFCRLVAHDLAPASQGDWLLTIGLRGSKSRAWALSARPGRRWTEPGAWVLNDGRPSAMDDWHRTTKAELDPGLDAYQLLNALYEVFGLKFDDVDFAIDNSVDPDKIRGLNDS